MRAISPTLSSIRYFHYAAALIERYFCHHFHRYWWYDIYFALAARASTYRLQWAARSSLTRFRRQAPARSFILPAAILNYRASCHFAYGFTKFYLPLRKQPIRTLPPHYRLPIYIGYIFAFIVIMMRQTLPVGILRMNYIIYRGYAETSRRAEPRAKSVSAAAASIATGAISHRYLLEPFIYQHAPQYDKRDSRMII